MDIFTQDILRLKNEKEVIRKESQEKDEVIEALNKNITAWKDRLNQAREKFETCKQAVRRRICFSSFYHR